MNDTKDILDGFKLSYEKFMTTCDALEAQGRWPLDELGEMEAWFTNDMFCLIAALSAADGTMHAKEALYLNDALDFQYSPEELVTLYEDLGPQIETFLEKGLLESLAMLTRIDSNLAAEYRTMLTTIAKFVIECDGITLESEIKAAEKLLNSVSVGSEENSPVT